MTHLPKFVQDCVDPILKKFAKHKNVYPNFGFSFSKFDHENDCPADDPNISLQEELDRYNWWFISPDEFDNDRYVDLYNMITKFNKETKHNIKLHLGQETGGTIRRICHSDSDNYGTYYFLITATEKDGSKFPLPKSYDKYELDEEYYGYDSDSESE